MNIENIYLNPFFLKLINIKGKFMTLKSLNNRAKRIRKGFTLVELMIVVAIIAILAAAIVIGYAHARTSAQVAASVSNLKEISTALELYYADNQVYPVAAAAPVTSNLLGGQQYMPGSPVAPDFKNYVLTSSGNTYVIGDLNDYAKMDVQSVCPNTPRTDNYLVYGNGFGLGCSGTVDTTPST